LKNSIYEKGSTFTIYISQKIGKKISENKFKENYGLAKQYLFNFERENGK